MKLNTQITGAGKDMVIIHGFLGMGDNWRTLSKSFASEGYRVHTPDMRNHGKSPHSEDFSYEVMAKDVKSYFDEHSIKKAIVIGHSMGGKIAMFFASMYPECIEKLIIVDISPKHYKPHHDEILESLRQLKNSQLNSRKEAEEILKQRISNGGVRLFLLKNLKRLSDNTLAVKPNIEAFIANKEYIGQALPQTDLIDVDTLFIRGANSNYIDRSDESLIPQQFTSSKIVTIANAGHWVHAENPKAFFDAVVKFINE